MTDEHASLMAKCADERLEVCDQRPGAVGIDAFGLVGAPVAAQVRRDDMETRCEGRHDGAPGEPALREAVQQEQQRTARVAARRVVQAQRPRRRAGLCVLTVAHRFGHRVATLQRGRWATSGL